MRKWPVKRALPRARKVKRRAPVLLEKSGPNPDIHGIPAQQWWPANGVGLTMADWNDNRTSQRGFGQTGFGASPGLSGEVARGEVFDAGLRKHMLSIYNYMASGVLLTGIVAMLTASSGFVYTIMNGPLMWLVVLSPLAIVMAMSF